VTVLGVLVSFFCSMLAAFIAHYLSSSRNQRSELLRFQIQSYSDFLSAASKLSVARRLGDTSNEESTLALLNEAKTKIITCGDSNVVDALISYWEAGGTLEREQEIIAYNALIREIRLGLNVHDNRSLMNEISDTLFKLEPSSFSYKASKGLVECQSEVNESH